VWVGAALFGRSTVCGCGGAGLGWLWLGLGRAKESSTRVHAMPEPDGRICTQRDHLPHAVSLAACQPEPTAQRAMQRGIGLRLARVHPAGRIVRSRQTDYRETLQPTSVHAERVTVSVRE